MTQRPLPPAMAGLGACGSMFASRSARLKRYPRCSTTSSTPLVPGGGPGDDPGPRGDTRTTVAGAARPPGEVRVCRPACRSPHRRRAQPLARRCSGVLTLSPDLRTPPAGTLRVQVCRGQGCASVGGAAMADHARASLALAFAATAADGWLTLEQVFCLGRAGAPALLATINWSPPNVAHRPGAQSVASAAAHLRACWAPSMRAEIFTTLREVGPV
jgi:hypothetical protein